MKNWKILALICILGSASVFAAQEIKTPRKLVPTIKLSNHKAINAYLISLVEEYEEKLVGDELKVYLEASDKPCKLINDQKLSCEYSYLQDRWGGDVALEFRVKRGRVVELSKAEFSGSF